jgi:hypothetical protein
MCTFSTINQIVVVDYMYLMYLLLLPHGDDPMYLMYLLLLPHGGDQM